MGGLTWLLIVLPGILVVIALSLLFRQVWRAIVVFRLNGGERTTGRVVGANLVVTHSKSRNSRLTDTRSDLVETIEFTDQGGRVVRGIAYVSDHGMLDREGMEVTVLYNTAKPERFIAPADGERIGLGGQVGAIAIALVVTFVACLVALFFGAAASTLPR